MILENKVIEQIINENWSMTLPLTFHNTVSAHGSDNIIFSTADGEKYIFRVIFWDPDIIHDGSQIYELLYEAGIPVPLPILTDEGEYCVPGDIEDRDAGYSIHTFIDADEEVDKSKLDKYIGHLGTEMGKFHTALYNIDVNQMDLRGRDTLHYEPDGIGFHPPLEDEIPDDPLIQEMYQFWMDWKDQLEIDDFTSGIVHGDIGPGANIMIKDQRVAAFIDLIGVGGGLYMADIGGFVMYGGLFREDRATWLEQFKTNYVKHSPVSEQEFEYLPFFLLWRFLIQALYFGWRLRTKYTQGNTPDSDNQDGMDHALGVLKFWKERYGHLMD